MLKPAVDNQGSTYPATTFTWKSFSVSRKDLRVPRYLPPVRGSIYVPLVTRYCPQSLHDRFWTDQIMIAPDPSKNIATWSTPNLVNIALTTRNPISVELWGWCHLRNERWQPWQTTYAATPLRKDWLYFDLSPSTAGIVAGIQPLNSGSADLVETLRNAYLRYLMCICVF